MKELGRSIFIFIVFTVLAGFGYPFFVAGIAGWCFPHEAKGSLIMKGNDPVGSSLIGQRFTASRYFHGRPSASDYNAVNSGGVNLGPGSGKLIADVKNRVEIIRRESGIFFAETVPADFVLSSASGLDPHISIDAAFLQAPRIARSRGLATDDIRGLIERISEGRGFFGPARINVLKANMALDVMNKKTAPNGKVIVPQGRTGGSR